jgi:hypothetical protein
MYDQRGRKTSSTDPDLGIWTYTATGSARCAGVAPLIRRPDAYTIA